MKKHMKDYFPMIRTRSEVLGKIKKNPLLYSVYSAWTWEQQELFLDYCTGNQGLKMLYDGFFKEVMNPEYAPERLNDFLSSLLGETIHIKTVLPNDSTRISDERSLLSMDIVVEFTDGRLANVEVQKIGYAFPGTRSACYSADLLLRQYKRLRGEKGEKFSYRDIENVYVIVLFESSPKEFKECPVEYRHYSEQKVDTGIDLKQPQKFLYLPLDIFRKKQDNENGTINNRLEAWLTFFGRDEPEMIFKLIRDYPEFGRMYEEVYRMCLNMEKVMEMFSKELLELDRNTVDLMIDEMQDQIDRQEEMLIQKNETIQMQSQWLSEKDEQLSQKDEQLSQKDEQLSQKDEQLSRKDETIQEQLQQLKALQEEIEALKHQIKR